MLWTSKLSEEVAEALFLNYVRGIKNGSDLSRKLMGKRTRDRDVRRIR